MQIGNIRLGAPVALAPMAGITDMPVSADGRDYRYAVSGNL